MKIIFFIITLFITHGGVGQNLNLSDLENALENPKSNQHREILLSNGFELIQEENNGKSGLYEKWGHPENSINIVIQHNTDFKFSKLLISALSTEPIDKLIKDITQQYNRTNEKEEVFYTRTDRPNLVIHEIVLNKDDVEVQGLLFFQRF